MCNATADRGAPSLTAPERERIPALGLRSALALLAVVVGLFPFLVLWRVVVDRWPPLARLDGSVADVLNDAVRDDPALVEALRAVTDLGGTPTAAVVMGGATVLLAMRRRWRPAMFLAVTGIGLLILIPLTKALIDRARPVVDVAVVAPPENASFPSGHSMASLVVWVSIVLVARPHLPRPAHPFVWSGVAVVVAAVGFTRLALGVHFVSDVLAGWALGAAWVGASATVFWIWQRSSGRDPDVVDPVGEAADRTDGGNARVADAPLHEREARSLLGAWTALLLVFAGAGLAVTGAGPGSVRYRFDQWALDLLARPRSEVAATAAEWLSSLAGSTAVTAVGLALVVLAATLPQPGRAMLFVAAVVLGEVLLYFVVSRVVGRARPELGELAPGLPAQASWPSGHAAAAIAVYGAVAILLAARTGSTTSRSSVLVPLTIAPLVAWSRVYAGEHYPTDVVAGLLLGGLWLAACTLLVLRPGGPASPSSTTTRRSSHAH